MVRLKPLLLYAILAVIILFSYLIYQNKQLIRRQKNSYFFGNKISDSFSENPIETLYRYVSLPIDYKYGSNSIPLAVAALSTKGDILELGMGMFSTPLLHKVAIDQGRKLVSVDTEFEWVEKFAPYNISSSHKVYFLSMDDLMVYGLEKNGDLY